MKRRIIAPCLILLLVICCSVSASAQRADVAEKGSVSVTLTAGKESNPVSGAELSLYLVATARTKDDGKLSFVYTEEFENAGIDLEDPRVFSKPETWFGEIRAEAEKAVTDSQGRAVFSDLTPGIYFIKQTGAAEGFTPCKSFCVTIPFKSGNEYIYHVDASPKTEVSELVTVTVKKLWNTDKAAEAADSVTVQLLKEGRVIETAVLSKENNWQVSYGNMPESDAYSIKEINIPKGFTASYKQNGYEFTVINSSTLIQTGQLVWPIPVLAMAGMLLFAAGIVIMKGKKRSA